MNLHVRMNKILLSTLENGNDIIVIIIVCVVENSEKQQFFSLQLQPCPSAPTAAIDHSNF